MLFININICLKYYLQMVLQWYSMDNSMDYYYKNTIYYYNLIQKLHPGGD